MWKQTNIGTGLSSKYTHCKLLIISSVTVHRSGMPHNCGTEYTSFCSFGHCNCCICCCLCSCSTSRLPFFLLLSQSSLVLLEGELSKLFSGWLPLCVLMMYVRRWASRIRRMKHFCSCVRHWIMLRVPTYSEMALRSLGPYITSASINFLCSDGVQYRLVPGILLLDERTFFIVTLGASVWLEA